MPAWLVGSALCRQLESRADCTLITSPHAELNLTRQTAVEAFFTDHTIDEVYLAAAKVGGIHAISSYPVDFLYDNLLIPANVIHAAHRAGVQKLLFLGSSCIYPRMAAQPMGEGALLTGVLEPTNEPYAIAKIAGIKLRESYNRQHGRDYRSVMPTNLYGPGDNYHPENSHVIPALTGFGGRLVFDSSKPDGAPRKLLDVSKLAAMGWQATMGLEDGLREAYAWFREHGPDTRS
ncbi:NAD-dependent epimerase/dehydratase family protein [Haliea sp. E1-2-M8]|uniref:NAD-dependent epimerase/dehydratase family protein n=1 Tax=Haliea sp. E1-2-M8 TaxID=3064706 RepID=UPI00351C439A